MDPGSFIPGSKYLIPGSKDLIAGSKDLIPGSEDLVPGSKDMVQGVGQPPIGAEYPSLYFPLACLSQAEKVYTRACS